METSQQKYEQGYRKSGQIRIRILVVLPVQKMGKRWQFCRRHSNRTYELLRNEWHNNAGLLLIHVTRHARNRVDGKFTSLLFCRIAQTNSSSCKANKKTMRSMTSCHVSGTQQITGEAENVRKNPRSVMAMLSNPHCRGCINNLNIFRTLYGAFNAFSLSLSCHSRSYETRVPCDPASSTTAIYSCLDFHDE